MIKSWLQFNENFSGTKIENINQEDIPEILELCAQVFGDVNSHDEVKEFLGEEANFNISKKATVDGKIVGCYLFNETPITEFLNDCNCLKEDISSYEGKRGIQGLGLAVLPEYRGKGAGRMLRDVPLKMGYDYIWGQHLKGLHNIDHWTKFGRRIIADGIIGPYEEDMYVTLMDL